MHNLQHYMNLEISQIPRLNSFINDTELFRLVKKLTDKLQKDLGIPHTQMIKQQETEWMACLVGLCQEAWSLPGSSHPETVYISKRILRGQTLWGVELYQAQKIPQAQNSWQLKGWNIIYVCPVPTLPWASVYDYCWRQDRGLAGLMVQISTAILTWKSKAR